MQMGGRLPFTGALLLLTLLPASMSAEYHSRCDAPVTNSRQAAEYLKDCTHDLENTELRPWERVRQLRDRAQKYIDSHNLPSALTDCNEALNIEPDYPDNKDALLLRAVVNTHLGHWQEAEVDIEQVLSRDPHNFLAWSELSSVHIGMGKFDAAGTDLNRASGDVANGPSRVLGGFGGMIMASKWPEILALQGRYDEAAALIEQQTQPGWDFRCEEMAEWHRDPNRLLPLCDAMIERSDVKYTFSRAVVYYRMGEYAEAIKDCNDDLDRSPSDPRTLYVRGLARLKNGDQSGGLKDIMTARRLAAGDVVKLELYGLKP